MKILLDENLPHELRDVLTAHDVYTVSYLHWDGIVNGELLALAGKNDFDALVTMDRGLRYQQYAATLPLSVVILRAPSNAMKELNPLVKNLLAALKALRPKTIVEVGPSSRE